MPCSPVGGLMESGKLGEMEVGQGGRDGARGSNRTKGLRWWWWGRWARSQGLGWSQRSQEPQEGLAESGGLPGSGSQAVRRGRPPD